jgi:hypothetical protein
MSANLRSWKNTANFTNLCPPGPTPERVFAMGNVNFRRFPAVYRLTGLAMLDPLQRRIEN